MGSFWRLEKERSGKDDPDQREEYKLFLSKTRPKYIPMKAEDVEMLFPEDREVYKQSLKLKKSRYLLRPRPY